MTAVSFNAHSGANCPICPCAIALIVIAREATRASAGTRRSPNLGQAKVLTTIDPLLIVDTSSWSSRCLTMLRDGTLSGSEPILGRLTVRLGDLRTAPRQQGRHQATEHLSDVRMERAGSRLGNGDGERPLALDRDDIAQRDIGFDIRDQGRVLRLGHDRSSETRCWLHEDTDETVTVVIQFQLPDAMK